MANLIIRLLPLVAGLVWLLAFHSSVPVLTALLPGTLLLGGGVAAVLLKGDFRTPQLVSMGGLVGVITAVCLVISIEFMAFLWLLLLSLGAFIAAGRGFEETPQAADVPLGERPLVLAGKAALDEAALGGVIRFMLRSPDEKMLDSIADESLRAITVLEDGGYLASPGTWHGQPGTPEMTSEVSDSFHGLNYQKIRFTSGYQPSIEFPGFERWQGYENNRTAEAIILKHNGPPRPWLVCIHGGGMGSDAMNLVGMQATKFHNDHGLNVAVPVLPLHGARSFGRMNGVGIIGSYLTNTLFGLSQAAWDIRQIINWLRAEQLNDEQADLAKIGLYGISLGGYTTSLLTQLEADLACAVAGIPASQLAPMLIKMVEPRIVSGLAERGIGFKEMERLYKVISPLALPPKLALDKRYIFAGIVDRMVPAAHVAELWRHWEKPRIEWYQGSHVTWRWEGPAQNLLDEAIEKHLSG